MLANNLWVFDGEAVKFLGLPFTTRMTVIRLNNGDLWVHSPIKLTKQISSQLDEIGVIQYLIAPNHLHHLFLAEWQEAYPDALCFGILAPNGKMPLDWRLSFVFHKAKARRHLNKIMEWKPKTIIMAHGLIVKEDADAFLRRSFAWLKR